MPQVNYHRGGPALERSNLGRILSFPHKRAPTYLEKAAVYFVSIWPENYHFSKKILWLNDLVNLITCAFSLPS